MFLKCLWQEQQQRMYNFDKLRKENGTTMCPASHRLDNVKQVICGWSKALLQYNPTMIHVQDVVQEVLAPQEHTSSHKK